MALVAVRAPAEGVNLYKAQRSVISSFLLSVRLVFTLQFGSYSVDMSYYILDTSVASLILDGELWERDPHCLMGHRKELLFLKSDKQCEDTQQLPTHSLVLRRSLNGYKWVKERLSKDQLPLLITPTVKVSCIILNFANFVIECSLVPLWLLGVLERCGYRGALWPRVWEHHRYDGEGSGGFTRACPPGSI